MSSNSANMATNDTEPKKDEIVYIESTKHHFAMESQRSSLPPSHTTSMNTTFVKDKELTIKKNAMKSDLLNNSQDEHGGVIKDFDDISFESSDDTFQKCSLMKETKGKLKQFSSKEREKVSKV